MNKKEKEQKLKELSNKYFWEQKTNEIGLFILIASLVLIVLYMSGSIMLMLNSEGVCMSVDSDTGIEYNCTDNIWLIGFLGLILLSIICGVLFCLGWLFWILIEVWIKSNKEKAEKRAKKELGIKEEEYY